MKTLKLSLCLLLATLLARLASADLVGPYTPDANTLFLFHFDEAAGGSVATNVGSKGGNSYTVDMAVNTATPPLVTTMLGATGYVSGPINFGASVTNPTTGNLVGYDFNISGAFQADTGVGAPSADRLAMTNLNIGNGGQTAFTLEALIQPTTTVGSKEIICTDNTQTAGNGTRGFQFRISSGTLQLQFIGGTPGLQAVSGTIPVTGPNAFVAGNWYHVAVTYDGTTARLYWTKVDPSAGAAQLLNSAAMALGTTHGAIQGPLIIGNENRNTATEGFLGSIDEVRISSVARAANEMQFNSPNVTITQQPVSQNVDYNQPVTFSVGASSDTALGYQWRFNSNSIIGATSSSYVIANVAANNGGYYDVVVTNAISLSATSSPALLVVGAANFLNHRYSFTTDTSDSIGTATGTNFGTATVTGGALVLDGTAGTYMELPGNLFNGANATALTVEFWAAFGASGANARVFDFGNTNTLTGGSGINYVGYSPNAGGGQQLHISGGDISFQQTATSPGSLNGLSQHVVCVIDPPKYTLSIYTNGVLAAVNTNLTVGIASLNDAYSFIGRSLFTSHSYLNASIDELRIFNGALGSLTVKQSYDQGPNTLLADGPAEFVTQPVNTSVAVGQTATFTATAIGYLPISYQWFKNATLVPGATNTSYTFATVIGDNGSTFTLYATNTIGVTTYVTNSTTATLTVVNPPTLAWLDAANGGADGDWNTTSLNWTNVAGGAVTAYAPLNRVLFDSRNTGPTTVNLVDALNPATLTANATTDYVLTSFAANGSLTGQGGIVKQGSGKLTIDVTNNMTSGTTISGGTLQIGNGGTTGTTGSGNITNNGTLVFNRSGNLPVANAISGTGAVQMDGGGSVTLSGSNSYTGSTLVNAGIISVQNASGLGTASAGTTVANGGQVYVTAAVDTAEPLTLNGAGDGNGALRKSTGASTWNALINLATDSTIGVDGGATLVLSNVVSGTAALTLSGGGTLALDVNNTYNGGTTLSGPGVQINASRALSTGPVTVSGGGRFVIGTGLTITNAFTANATAPGAGQGLLMVNDNTNGTVTTVSGPLALNVPSASGGHLVGPTSSGYLNVSGPVTMPAATTLTIRAGNIRFSGSGSSYDEIQVAAGTTSLGANNAIAINAAMDIGASTTARFDLNGFNQTLAGLSAVSAFPAIVTNSAVTPVTLTLNLPVDKTYDGVIAGPVAVVKTGAAVQTLSGTNNAYTGNTTVSAGTLVLNQPKLVTNSTVTVANSAVLQLDFAGSETNQIAGLVLGGVNQAPGVYDSTSGAPYLTGTGFLLVVPVSTVPTYRTNLTATVNGSNFIVSWPATHLGWTLQAQTNTLATGLGTNWVTVPNSATVNAVTNAINSANGAVFYRMALP